MALTRVACPECGAGLKSPTGFDVGQSVCCPKCETYFSVEEPSAAKRPVKAAVAHDDYEQPTKKKKRSADDDDAGNAYKNSTARYAILGVLICVMVGLGVMLYLKKRDEGKDDNAGQNDRGIPKTELPKGTIDIVPGGPVGAGAGPAPKKNPNPKTPVNPKTNPGTPGGGFSIPFVDGSSSLSPADAAAKVKELQSRIVGTWKAELGGGKKSELVYNADGSFTDTITIGGKPTTITGKWTAERLIAGNKGILIARTVGATQTKVKAEFEGDELLHDTQERGTVGTFRK